VDKFEKIVVCIAAVALFLTIGLILLVRGFPYTQVYRYDINLEAEGFPAALKMEVVEYATELEEYFGEIYVTIEDGILRIRMPRERILGSPYEDFFLAAEAQVGGMYHLVRNACLSIAGIVALYGLYLLKFGKTTKYNYWGFPVDEEVPR
jgi:hypothetical protein